MSRWQKARGAEEEEVGGEEGEVGGEEGEEELRRRK